MKYVKFIVTAMIALFCFVMTSELFQLHLQTFTNGYFFIEIGAVDPPQACAVTASVAEEYNEHVFAISRVDTDAFHSTLTIYADEATREVLSSTQDIRSGEIASFFSGSTEISILPFESLADDVGVTRYYFTGSRDTVSAIRQSIYNQIPSSYVHKEDASIAVVAVYSVWAISLLFLLLLTWADIQFRKKSDFLKISMGRSVGGIIRNNILFDLILDAGIFAAAYLALRNRIFLGYKQGFVFGAIVVFLVLNSLLHTTLLRVDYKEVLYGANINERMLANTYLMQAIVAILLVLSLSFNVTILRETAEELAPYDTIDQMEGYVTLSITPTAEITQDEEKYSELQTDLYLEAYLQDRVMLATFSAGYEDELIVVVNEEALPLVTSNPALFQNDSTSDFVVYIPEDRYETMDDYDIEFAAVTTASNFFGMEDCSYETRSYPHADVVYFDLRRDPELSYGSEEAHDPILVYCNLSETQLQQLQENHTEILFGDNWAKIIFRLEDTSIFSESVLGRLQRVELVSVPDLCRQYESSLLRTVLLNSILSVFLLILSIFLVSAIVKMEYMVHSKELALKKIFGYSILKRNRSFLVLHTITVAIALITGVIFSAMYAFFAIWLCCLVALAVWILNGVLILLNMALAERNNTITILKGGAL